MSLKIGYKIKNNFHFEDNIVNTEMKWLQNDKIWQNVASFQVKILASEEQLNGLITLRGINTAWI